MRGSIFLRRGADPRGDNIVVVFNDDSFTPQHLIVPIDKEFMKSCRREMFIIDADDTPISERCVGVFMGQSNGLPEGYFYRGFYTGHEKRLLAPDTHRTVDGAVRPR